MFWYVWNGSLARRTRACLLELRSSNVVYWVFFFWTTTGATSRRCSLTKCDFLFAIPQNLRHVDELIYIARVLFCTFFRRYRLNSLPVISLHYGHCNQTDNWKQEYGELKLVHYSTYKHTRVDIFCDCSDHTYDHIKVCTLDYNIKSIKLRKIRWFVNLT